MDENKTEILESKTETVEEVKEETTKVDIDVTATTNPPEISVVDARQNSQESLKVDDMTERTSKIDIQFAEQSKQLEEMKRELDELRNTTKTLTEQKEKLENDISSLRENPFYNPSKNVNGLPNKNVTEYSYEDIRNMRKGI